VANKPAAQVIDYSKPREGKTTEQVVVRFNAIRDAGFEGFRSLRAGTDEMPAWMWQVLAHFDKTNIVASETLREFLITGRLMTGEDREEIFYGANNGEIILLATNGVTDAQLAETL